MSTVKIILAVYVLICIVMYAAQRNLMYFPTKIALDPARYDLPHLQKVTWPSADGTRLTLWTAPPQDGFPIIVYYHGNAGHLGMRNLKYGGLVEAGFGMVALSYRGYGDSEGSPEQMGIYADARAALTYAQQELSKGDHPIILYGESLGTGVATHTAAEHDVSAVILEAPYTSILKRSYEIYPYLPVGLLLKDRFESLKKLVHIKVPIMILHGEDDATVPVHHGRAMLEAANDPKEAVFFPGIGHTDFDIDAIVAHVKRFATKHGLIEN